MSELLRERQGHIEILTINRPEARNAINLATATALSDALDDIEADDDVWVVVLTAAGDKAFSAGMDLKAFASGEFPITEKGFGGITKRDFPKALIAACNGSALAGGCEIMLSCDLVVAADHAKFGIPEVARGLVAGAGGLIRLPKRIPRAIALELALTGEPIDAQRALQIGLVNRVVPGDQLMTEAMALAERIAKNAPMAVRLSKQVMKQAAELTEAEGWVVNDAVFGEIGAVDVLVNNAGIGESASLPATTLDAWRRHLEVNATGPFLCTRAVVPGMRERGAGAIVTVASTAGRVGVPYTSAYSASKHAVIGLTRAVASELAGTGVRVNAVCPGFVRTEMTERSIATIVAKTGRSPAQAEAALCS